MDLLTAIFYIAIFIIAYKLVDRLLRIPRISNLDSRYILVTGCDTGFGNAIAKRLDGLGCHVIAACLTESGETELRKSCSTNLNTLHLDVSNPESVKRAFDQVSKLLPSGKGLWGVLNNAGIGGRAGPLQWNNMEDFHKVTSVNLFGLIDVAMTFLPLVKKEKGRVVNTASLAGRIAGATAPYCVSKYGVEAFSDHLRRDMRDYKVSVSIIEPEFFSTNMTALEPMIKGTKEMFEGLPPSLREEYGREYLENLCANSEKLLKTMIKDDISPVLDAYTHALLGSYPRARYVVGSTAWFLLRIQDLPEWVGDRILKALGGAQKPAVCK